MRDVEFVTKIAKSGEKKIIIIPKRYHELVKKRKLTGIPINVILEHLD